MKPTCLRVGRSLVAVAILIGLLPGCIVLDLGYYAAFPPRLVILDASTGKTKVVGRSSQHVVSVSESSKTFCTVRRSHQPEGPVTIRTYGFDGTRKSRDKYPDSLIGHYPVGCTYALSPNGNVLACASWNSSDGSLLLLDLDTGASEAVVAGLLPTGDRVPWMEDWHEFSVRIEWLSDTQLALIIPSWAKVHPKTIALLDLSAGDLRVLYRCPEGLYLQEGRASFSADRRYMAFVESDDKYGSPFGQTWVKVLNLQTGEVFSAEQSFKATISPDSRRVAYIEKRKANRRLRYNLKVFDLQTGDLVTAIKGVDSMSRLCWSLDSNLIACRSDLNIVSYSLSEDATTEVKRFSWEPADPYVREFWFSDNRRLFCEFEFRSSDTKLVAIDVQTGDVTVLARDSVYSPLPIDAGSKALCTLKVRRTKLRLRK